MDVFQHIICMLCIVHVVSVEKDIVFVVDRSGSISDSGFRNGIDFIYNVTKWLTIGRNDLSVSLVSFDNQFTDDIKPGSYYDRKSLLLQKIASLKTSLSPGGGTMTGRALWHVINDILPQGRPHAHKVVVVLTDGQSGDETDIPASVLKDQYNAEIFAIKVGTANIPELISMASQPPDHYVCKAQDFIYLCNIIPSLVPKLDPTVTARANALCPTPPPTTLPPTRWRPTTTPAPLPRTKSSPPTTISSTKPTHLSPRPTTSSTEGSAKAENSKQAQDASNNIGIIVGAVLGTLAMIAGIGVAYFLTRGQWLKNSLAPAKFMEPYEDAPVGQQNARFDPRYLH